MHRSLLSYVQKHWNGELKLREIFWVNTILLFIILQIALLSIHSIIHEHSTHYDIQKYTTFILLWLILSSAILIWQITGNLHESAHAERPLLNIVGIAKNATLALLSLWFLVQILFHLPATFHYIKISLTTDDIGKKAAQLKVRNNSVEIKGAIDFRLPDRLLKLIRSNPEIRTITLDSTGGYMPPARRAALLIMRKNLDTHVQHVCKSACTFIFAAGKKRSASVTAKLGFHPPSANTIFPFMGTKHYRRDTAFLKTRSISIDFIKKIYSTIPSKLWFPDHKELINSGYVTHTTGSTSK